MGRLTSSKEKICGNCCHIEFGHRFSSGYLGPWCKNTAMELVLMKKLVMISQRKEKEKRRNIDFFMILY